jgi:D-alanyl-D-alanine carboxypeptidase
MTQADRPTHLRRAVALAGVLVVALAALASCSDDTGDEGATDGSTPVEGGIEAVEGVVDEQLTAAGVPGWVVVAWTPDDEVTLVEGDAELDPDRSMDEDAVFQIRSITKSFTVTLLLQLVDEGLISLEDPIARFVDGVPGGDEITLAQLASMRSGLPDYATDAFVEMLVTEPEHVYEPQELLDLAFAEPVSFAPGDGYEYSNTNTVLLGMVVEQVAETPLEQVYAERIWTPLDMADSAYPVDGPLPDPHVVGYDVDPETLEADPALQVSLSALGAAGGMVSVATDLRTWADALVEGTLLEPGTQALRFDAAGPTDGGPEYDAYGLGIGEIDGWWGHTGEGLGFATAVLRDPDRDAGVVILLNGSAERDTPATLARQLIPLLTEGGS